MGVVGVYRRVRGLGVDDLAVPVTVYDSQHLSAGEAMDDQVKWLAALLHGYDHYPETFGEDWPNVLAESLACHLWPKKASGDIFRSGGQTKQYGPRPRIATARPDLT